MKPIQQSGSLLPSKFVRTDYLFSEAFELIGKRLFGDEWLGWEIRQMRLESPAELEARRRPFDEAIHRAQSEIEKIREQIGKTVAVVVMAELEKQLEDASNRRMQKIQERLSITELTDGYVANYRTYERRMTVEEHLFVALKRGVIKAHNGQNSPIDNVLWQGHRNFRAYIEMSIVRLPRSHYSPRLQPARIEIEHFNSWLVTLEPVTESAKKAARPPERVLTELEQFQAFLSDRIASNGPPPRKPNLWLEAHGKFPGLSERQFNFEWKTSAPASWKARGRRALQK